MNAKEAAEKVVSLVMSDSFTAHIDNNDTIYFSRVGQNDNLNPLQVIVTNFEGDVSSVRSIVQLARDAIINIDEAGDLLAATRPVHLGNPIASKRSAIRQQFFALVEYSQRKKAA